MLLVTRGGKLPASPHLPQSDGDFQGLFESPVHRDRIAVVPVLFPQVGAPEQSGVPLDPWVGGPSRHPERPPAVLPPQRALRSHDQSLSELLGSPASNPLLRHGITA